MTDMQTAIFVDEDISLPGELKVNLKLPAGDGFFHGMGLDICRMEAKKGGFRRNQWMNRRRYAGRKVPTQTMEERDGIPGWIRTV